MQATGSLTINNILYCFDFWLKFHKTECHQNLSVKIDDGITMKNLTSEIEALWMQNFIKFGYTVKKIEKQKIMYFSFIVAFKNL